MAVVMGVDMLLSFRNQVNSLNLAIHAQGPIHVGARLILIG